jgi:hypothetical protein
MQGSLKVLPYDPAWPLHFAAERKRLQPALGQLALRIDHNGSTAVPGLAAKPVIDIQISGGRSCDRCIPRTTARGYQHVPHADDAFCVFFIAPTRGHIRTFTSSEQAARRRRTLAFQTICAITRTCAGIRGAEARLRRNFPDVTLHGRHAEQRANIRRIIKPHSQQVIHADTLSV